MSQSRKDRRKYARVPMVGPITWQSQSGEVRCQVCDVSPSGAALAVSHRDAPRVGDHVALEMPLAPNLSWSVASKAKVIRKSLSDSGMARIGLSFDEERP